uniref:MITF_TFEB_C_3_N domain-containing protein n=1 Tax=Macrostomum lignano TaxID=282301 RepID=A0A1I8IAC5_9PLAT
NLTATRPQQQQAATLAANPLPVEVEIRTRNTVNQAAQDRRQPAAPAAPPPQIPLRDKRSSQLHPVSPQ